MFHRTATARTRLIALIAAVTVIGGAATAAATSSVDPTASAGMRSAGDTLMDASGGNCRGQGPTPAATRGGPRACAHEDAAPAGVDVTKAVATATLEARRGASATAVRAAQEQGVVTATSLAGTTSQVPCDGDGASGYRVQAVYVVTSDKANRYAAVADQLQQWAAGVNTVFNRSAAKTGGIRDVRFVTTSSGGVCTPAVLNVTLPPGAIGTFNSTITAMQAAGYTSAARKYLMWVDGTGYCGIAQTYTSSAAGQSNPNNGYYPQFARIDTGCWGQSLSVEAHELSHTLGSVQGDAPHSTKAGHCWDEYDRMCYSDGGAFAMKQICSPDQEPLLDCNDDDYYSTFPPAGSYLATHWNTADSRFLIGGGDGVGGGTAGTPTRLGGTIAINNPAVPGLPTQVQANLEVVPGRTATVAWSTTRSDCAFADRSAAQTTLTCNAPLTANAPVTATFTDSAGEKVTRSSAVTFDKTPRTAVVTLTVNGATGAHVACPTGRAVLQAKVVDAATGTPVKGAAVSFKRTAGTTTTTLGTATGDATGVATTAALTMAAGTLTATTVTSPAWPATSTTAGTPVTVTTSPCTTALTWALDTTSSYAGDRTTATGTLTRTLPGGSTGPAAGESASILGRKPGATTWVRLTSATTDANGSFQAPMNLLETYDLKAALVARAAYTASETAPVRATVTPWTTAVTTAVSGTDVAAGSPVTVTGQLTQTGAGEPTPMAKTAVAVTYPGGTGTASVSTTTGVDGRYTVVVRPTASGTVTVRYAGKLGWPATTATAPLSVRTWSTALTVDGPTAAVMAGTALRLTGTLTQTDAGATSSLASAPVKVTYPVPGGKTAIASVSTTAAGTWALTISPTASGPVSIAYAGKPGWAPATAATSVTVNEWRTALTSTASTLSATRGTYVTVTGVLTKTDTAGVRTALASSPVVVSYPTSATTVGKVTGTTSSTGTFSVRILAAASGPVTAAYVGKPGWAGAAATPLTLTVR